ncbi:Lateral flagellin [Massilia sp. KIM]|uniref:flagellin N-terminal helical domain-containing protein n=1 Tax=Massilia sp. KIM TaxID=1955422 RepID=UPI00098FCE91|nr:flagellin [Massilia sp. KIM]OON64085.1 Lateral flagellin [Massilia sp. KIM]
MLSLHTNNAGLSAQNAITRTQNSLSTSMTRLSTGYRINSAMDDAAGLQIATRLKAQTSGMGVAMRNTQNSTSMLQTAEGALDEVSNMLIRMKDLATQAADASSTTADKGAMQSEFDALGKELSNVLKNTTFAGSKLMDGGTLGTAALQFQIGASSSETMSVDLSAAMSAVTSAVSTATAKYSAPTATAAGTEIATGTAANTTITNLTTALDKVGELRSGLGAAANRLEHVYNNLANISTNSKAAAGRIMDVDFATESANMTSNQMLLQASTAMLKQSNSQSSLVMSLLQ